MAKLEIPVLRTFGNPSSGLIRFYVCEELEPKNGDQEYFGIVHINKYKTWAFFSQNQINDFKSDFKIKDLNQTGLVSELFHSASGFQYSRLKAKTDRFYFNAFLLYTLIPKKESERTAYSLDVGHSQYLNFKKNYNFMSLAYNDKPEVFFNKTVVCSYKSAKDCRFPLFNCNFTQQLKTNHTITDICSFLFGSTSEKELKSLKKHVTENLVTKKSSYYEINFYYLALMRMFSRCLGNAELVNLINTNILQKVARNPLFQELDSAFVGEVETISNLEKCIKFLYGVNPEWATKTLVKWDMPMDRKFLCNLEPFLAELKDNGIEFQMDRYVSLLYFFNMMSKEYSKLKTVNLELPNKPYEGLTSNFPEKIDEYKVVVAKDYKTLMQWGAYLHNCAGNFEQQKYYKESISLGFYKNGKIEFLATIKEGNLTQLKGFKNSAPSKEVYKKTLQALLDINAIKQSSKDYYKYDDVCIQTYVYAE